MKFSILMLAFSRAACDALPNQLRAAILPRLPPFANVRRLKRSPFLSE